MFIPAIAKSAAARWKASPEKAPAFESLVAARAQSPEIAQQRQDRIARLSQLASSEKARALVAAADASPRSNASQSDVIGKIALERVIGTRDLLDINFLELAIAIARSVGRMQNDNEFGTGFLVGPRLLMTNNHVIEDANSAVNWLFELDYQQNASGELLPVQTYRVDPTYFFYTNKTLDFTIAGVAAISDRQVPLSSYPWVKLIDAVGKIETGDPVNIIQHPNGGLKQIAFRQNHVITVTLRNRTSSITPPIPNPVPLVLRALTTSGNSSRCIIRASQKRTAPAICSKKMASRGKMATIPTASIGSATKALAFPQLFAN